MIFVRKTRRGNKLHNHFKDATIAMLMGCLTTAASAVDTFDYARYPASALTSWNSTLPNTCQSSDINSISFTVNGVAYSSLSDAPLKPGSVVEWKYGLRNAACADLPVSLALYEFIGTKGIETVGKYILVLVKSSTNTLSNGINKTVSLTVPKAFCGGAQLSAVLGPAVPRIGLNFTFYGDRRTVALKSDNRNMLVSSFWDPVVAGAPFVSQTTYITGATPNGACNLSDFDYVIRDHAGDKFDYPGYPANQSINPNCQTTSMADAGSTLGFFLNGVWVGNNLGVNSGNGTPGLVLKQSDVVEYRFKTSLPTCGGQPVSMALYRNPNGAAGMRSDYAQLMVASSTSNLKADGTIGSLQILVPPGFFGGWQLDIAYGNPLPIIGDIGATYGSMLKTSAAGFVPR